MDKIQIIEDNKKELESLEELLILSGYQTYTALTGGEGLKQFKDVSPDMLLLDLGLPDMDGQEIIREIRKFDSKTPIIVITGLDPKETLEKCFEELADDYIAKPYTLEELIARMNNAFAHKRIDGTNDIFKSGSLRIDYSTYSVYIDGEEVEFTTLEYNILTLLTKSAGKVLEYDIVIDKLSNKKITTDLDSLKVVIHRIRKKIGDDPKNPKFISNKYGTGYCFNKI